MESNENNTNERKLNTDIHVEVGPMIARKMDGLVTKETFKSRSEITRHALEKFLNKYPDPLEVSGQLEGSV